MLIVDYDFLKNYKSELTRIFKFIDTKRIKTERFTTFDLKSSQQRNEYLRENQKSDVNKIAEILYPDYDALKIRHTKIKRIFRC